jgi:hypothetical protein
MASCFISVHNNGTYLYGLNVIQESLLYDALTPNITDIMLYATRLSSIDNLTIYINKIFIWCAHTISIVDYLPVNVVTLNYQCNKLQYADNLPYKIRELCIVANFEANMYNIPYCTILYIESAYSYINMMVISPKLEYLSCNTNSTIYISRTSSWLLPMLKYVQIGKPNNNKNEYFATHKYLIDVLNSREITNICYSTHKFATKTHSNYITYQMALFGCDISQESLIFKCCIVE